MKDIQCERITSDAIEVNIEITPANGEAERVEPIVRKICEAFHQSCTLRINVKGVFR